MKAFLKNMVKFTFWRVLLVAISLFATFLYWETYREEFKLIAYDTEIDIAALKKKITSGTEIKTTKLQFFKFHPTDNKRALLGTVNGQLYLWDMNNNNVKSFVGHYHVISDAVINLKEQWIISAGLSDKTIRIWDMSSQQELENLPFQNSITRLALSPNNRYLAIGFYKEKEIDIIEVSRPDIVVWDLLDKKEVAQFYQHKAPIFGLSFSSDGQSILSHSYSQAKHNTAYLFEWRTGKIIDGILDSSFAITSSAFSPDNKLFAIRNYDGKILIRNIETQKSGLLYQKTLAQSGDLKFTQDGTKLFSAGSDNKITLHTLADKHVEPLFNTQINIQQADLSPSNTYFATALKDDTAFIYDLQGKRQHALILSEKIGKWISCDDAKHQCIDHTPSTLQEQLEKYWVAASIIILCLAFLFAFLRLRLFKHPLLLQLSIHPEELLNLPLQQLDEARKLLQITRRLNMVLSANQIAVHTFITATQFSRLEPLQRAKHLANRLLAQVKSSDNTEYYLIKLPKLFPLNIEECYFYFPNETDIATDIIEKLTLTPEFRKHKVIVITVNLEQQQGLQEYAQDIHNEVVVPNVYQLARWLLSPEATQTVSKLMASQLNLSYISPYYHSGSGIDKDTAFFGRTHIISQITGRSLRNYIIVGGRRIGKTSLLKYLCRHYEEQQIVKVYYFDATDNDLVRLLIDRLQLSRTSSFEDVVEYIRYSSETFLFLIDEVDVFINQDKQRNYSNLNKLRMLSAEGHCHFILAGFWHLYEATVFEYHCPLRNFGEIFELDILELDACYSLITRPLTFMNIAVANELKTHIIQQLGQRADLISQICHLLVINLDIRTRIITPSMVQEIFHHQDILRALYGWQTVAPTENERELDCIIMNLMLEEELFSLGLVSERLLQKKYSYDSTDIKKSLQRLVLCCVLKMNAGRYSYTIPLLKYWLILERTEDFCSDVSSENK